MAGLSLRLHYDAPSPSPFLEKIILPPLHTTLLESRTPLCFHGAWACAPNCQTSQNLPLMQTPPAGFVCGWARPPPDRADAGTAIKEAA